MRSHKKTDTRRIPAFTLPELVIGLLLMAILFGVIATVYMILARQSGHYFAGNRFFTDYYITKKLLQRDIEKARTVKLDPERNQLILQTKTGNHSRTTVYQLDTAFIVRTEPGRSDTLRPGAGIVAQRPINDSTPLLVYLKLRHRYRDQYFYTYLQKRYAKADLLNDSIQTEP
ncbi:hypothetical protein LL912_03645 [Niabella sp. CC-SYL272]|uniref:type II secretion system protein n=1 Tax=Niabella agricola TaxID=2891571 RepID=UPI001F3C604D|nr:hypothetical protein [Niabella agricola]MCF3107864.1 hypothetical protein [Niabella agricola]